MVPPNRPDPAAHGALAPARRARSRRGRAARCVLGVLAAACLGPTAAAKKSSEFLDVADLRPGMRGHAVTVFQGEKSDRFEVEIVDVIPNYLPRQDAILFRSNDPRMMHSGIVGGMSGSPIYIDGKLVGALAYGWRFNKDALGALTPIENMLRVGELPYRPESLPRPAIAREREGNKAWADAMLGLDTSPLPPRRRAVELDPTAMLEPLATPMSVSGFGPSASRMLSEALGMQAVPGGGHRERGAAPPPKRWSGGDAVSVVMVDGDSSVAGNGTVTWVSPKGDRLLAFGHSMFDDGPTNVPMADARVHTIINSLERSVKVSSPLDIRGVMYQDRQAAIALRTDARAPMIPVTTTIQGPDPAFPPRTYENRVAFGVSLTPNLVAGILAEAVDEAGRDATRVVLKLRHTISVRTTRGPRDLVFDEEVFFPTGTVGRAVQRSRGIVAISAMLDNQFEVVAIEGVRNSVEMAYGSPVETVENVRLVSDEVRAGDLARLELTLRDYQGERRRDILPIRIPDDAGGEEVAIEVAAGDNVRPYRPMPAHVDDLLTTLEVAYPPRSLVVTVYRQAEGLSMRGGLMSALPASVLDTLVDHSGTQSAVRLKQMARRVIPTDKLVEGTHTVHVRVLPRSSF